MGNNYYVPLTDRQEYFFFLRYAPQGVMTENKRTAHNRTVSDFCIVGQTEPIGVVVEQPIGLNRYMLKAQQYIIYMTTADAPPVELSFIYDADNLEPIEVKSLAELSELMKEEEQTVEASKKEVAELVAKSSSIDWWEQRRYEIAKEFLTRCYFSSDVYDNILKSSSTAADTIAKASVMMADALIKHLRQDTNH